MALEQQKQTEREFQDAKTPDEITKAQTHAILALVDCQQLQTALGWTDEQVEAVLAQAVI